MLYKSNYLHFYMKSATPESTYMSKAVIKEKRILCATSYEYLLLLYVLTLHETLHYFVYSYP